MDHYILFMVHPKDTNIRVFVWASDREWAKKWASVWLGDDGWGGKDSWEVTPLTNRGDRIHVDLTLSA